MADVYACSDCGVGINPGEETFNAKKTKVYCKMCQRDRGRNGDEFKDLLVHCLSILNNRANAGIDGEITRLEELLKR